MEFHPKPRIFGFEFSECDILFGKSVLFQYGREDERCEGGQRKRKEEREARIQV